MLYCLLNNNDIITASHNDKFVCDVKEVRNFLGDIKEIKKDENGNSIEVIFDKNPIPFVLEQTTLTKICNSDCEMIKKLYRTSEGVSVFIVYNDALEEASILIRTKNNDNSFNYARRIYAFL